MGTQDNFIPEWRLNLASWLLRHKEIFRKFGLFFLFLFDIIIVYQLGFRFVNYGVEDFRYTRLSASEVLSPSVHWSSYHAQHSPQSLQQVRSQVVPQRSGFFDVLVEVVNPNTEWGARELKYHFEIDGESFDQRTTLFLPQQSLWLTQFNVESSRAPRSVQVVFDNLEWVNVRRAHTLLDARDELSISNIVFENGRGRDESDRLRFLAVNTSPYSFWQAGFSIVAFDSSGIPVASYFLVNDLWESQSAGELEVVWTHSLPFGVRFEVTPIVDLLDPDSAYPPKGASSSPPGVDADTLKK